MTGKHIPTMRLSKKNNIPEITPAIRKLTIRRSRLYKKFKSAPPDPGRTQIEEILRDIKHQIQRDLSTEYYNHLDKIFTDSSDPNARNKRFWRFIKHNRTDNCGISELKHQGRSPTDKTNLLNAQFESVFTREGTVHRDQLGLPPNTTTISNDISFSTKGIKNLLD